MLYSVPTIGLAMPTDQDWGRLYKFNTTGDAGLIMPYRSYYFRDFVAGGWSNIAMGLIFCCCGNTGDTSTLIDERLSEDSPVNLPHFGISKSIAGIIDPANNNYFIGVRGALGGVTQIVNSTSTLGALLLTCVNSGRALTDGAPIQLSLNQGISSTPFAIFGVRFVFNQTDGKVYMFFNTSTGISLADDAANQTILNAYLDALPSDKASANASFALDSTANFSSYYIFWPYLVNKLKLHTVGMKKYA